MSGHCLIGSGRRLSEKPGHEGRADREYIPSQAMLGIDRGSALLSVQKGTWNRLLGPAALNCKEPGILQRPCSSGASRDTYVPHGASRSARLQLINRAILRVSVRVGVSNMVQTPIGRRV